MFTTKTSICSFVYSPNSLLSSHFNDLTSLFSLISFCQHSIHLVVMVSHGNDNHRCCGYASTMALWVSFGYFHFTFITLCVEIDFNVRTQSKCLAIEMSVVRVCMCTHKSMLILLTPESIYPLLNGCGLWPFLLSLNIVHMYALPRH